MNEHLDRAVAVVGVGAIMPDAPDAATFWENIKAGRYSISDVDPRPLGPGALLRPRSEGAGQDLLEDRRLGARLGVGPPRWKLPVMPRVATRWTTPRSGRFPARTRRLPTTAIRIDLSTTSGLRSCSAMRWPGRSTTRRRCASASPSSPRAGARPTFPPLSNDVQRGDHDETGHGRQAIPRDHRGHHAR